MRKVVGALTAMHAAHSTFCGEREEFCQIEETRHCGRLRKSLSSKCVAVLQCCSVDPLRNILYGMLFLCNFSLNRFSAKRQVREKHFRSEMDSRCLDDVWIEDICRYHSVRNASGRGATRYAVFCGSRYAADPRRLLRNTPPRILHIPNSLRIFLPCTIVEAVAAARGSAAACCSYVSNLF